jgi:hypothetical protein
MPYFQNTGLTNSGTLLLGSAKIEIAASVGASFTNLGLARGVSITESLTKFSVQADNGPTPIHGVSDQTVELSFDLLEFYLPSIDEIRGGIDTQAETSSGTWITSSTTIQQLKVGGKTEMASKVFKFTNYKMVSAATVETVIVVYSSTIAEGLSLAFQPDRAEDPVMPIPFRILGELDASRTRGDQLMIIETEMGIT